MAVTELRKFLSLDLETVNVERYTSSWKKLSIKIPFQNLLLCVKKNTHYMRHTEYHLEIYISPHPQIIFLREIC